MTRVATSFALSLWLGFQAVTGISELAHLAGVEAIGTIALEPAAGANPAASLFVALLTLGCAGAMAVSLVWIHGRTAGMVRRGERLAYASIGVTAAMVVAAALFGPPLAHVFDRVDYAFWSLFLTLVALVFDQAVSTAEDEDGDLAFRKALAAVERSVPDHLRHREPLAKIEEERR